MSGHESDFERLNDETNLPITAMTNKDGISVEGVRALLEGATPGPWGRADWSCDDGPDRFTIEASQPEVLPPGQSSIWPDGIRKMRVAEMEEGCNPEADGDLIAAAPSIAHAYLALSEREAAKDAEIAALVAKCAPMFPITTGQSCPDYADVHFGEGHSSQTMTHDPQHWDALNVLFAALTKGQVDAG